MDNNCLKKNDAETAIMFKKITPKMLPAAMCHAHVICMLLLVNAVTVWCQENTTESPKMIVVAVTHPMEMKEEMVVKTVLMPMHNDSDKEKKMQVMPVVYPSVHPVTESDQPPAPVPTNPTDLKGLGVGLAPGPGSRLFSGRKQTGKKTTKARSTTAATTTLAASTTPRPTPPTTVLPTSSRRCGAIIELDRGEIINPGYPLGYDAGLVCFWNITVSRQAPRIKLEFPRLNIGLDDFIEFRDERGQVLRRYIGNEKTKAFVTKGRTVTILFMTRTQKIDKHFVLTYLASYAKPTVVGYKAPFTPVQYISNTVGNITTANWPLRYYNLEDKLWVIKGDHTQIVTLTVFGRHFEVEQQYDYVMVGYGDPLKNVLLNLTTKLNETVAYSISSPTNQMWILFRTDETRTARGFYMLYDVGPRPSSLHEMEAASGTIESQNYPKPYPTNKVSEWRIKVPAHFFPHVRLKLTLTDMDLGQDDYLFIGTGEKDSKGMTMFRSFSGSAQAYEMKLNKRSAIVRFRAGNSTGVEHRGFRLSWHTYDVPVEQVQKEQEMKGVTQKAPPKPYENPSKKNRNGSGRRRNDKDDPTEATTTEPITTTPPPVNGFVVVVASEISKENFTSQMEHFKTILATTAQVYCQEYPCEGRANDINSDSVKVIATSKVQESDGDTTEKIEATIAIYSEQTEHGFALSDVELVDLIEMKSLELQSQLGYKLSLYKEEEANGRLPNWALLTIGIMVVLFLLFFAILVYSGRKRMKRMTKLYSKDKHLGPDLTLYQRPLPPLGYRHRNDHIKTRMSRASALSEASSNHYDNPTMLLAEIKAKRDAARASKNQIAEQTGSLKSVSLASELSTASKKVEKM